MNNTFTPSKVTATQAKQNITAICYDRKGNVLSIGKNSYVKTHPIQARFAMKMGKPHLQYLHAEIDALIRARRDVHRIQVIRVGMRGDHLPAKPCSVCCEAIRSYGVKVIEHT